MEVDTSDFTPVNRKRRKNSAPSLVHNASGEVKNLKSAKKPTMEKSAEKPKLIGAALSQNNRNHLSAGISGSSDPQAGNPSSSTKPGVIYRTTRAANASAPKSINEIDEVDGINNFSQKPPPIVLKTKESWLDISRALSALKVVILKSSVVSEGVRIQVQTPACYRATTRYFSSKSLPYFTYRLNEEREIKVVIRGIPVSIQDEQVIQELTEVHNFPVISVRRMGTRAKAFPMVAVYLKKSDESRLIYNLTRFCHLTVSVESLKPNIHEIQCHRCQSFGHGSLRCNVSPRCVKCAGDHITSECTRNREEDGAPKCANCGGSHTASFKGCGYFPKKKYSQAVGGSTAPPKPAASSAKQPQIGADVVSAIQLIASPEFASVLAQIKSILPALATLQKLNLA